MSSSTLRIEEFPSDGRPWRIDGLGRIVYSATSTSEPFITTHLSELSTDKVDPLMNGNQTGRGHVAFVKIGQIALLKLGSVWVDGIRSPIRASVTHTFSFDPTEFALHRLGATVPLRGINLQPLDASRFRVSRESSEGLADSWLAVGTPTASSMFFVAIPSSVLFQHCAATSAYAVRRLVWGEVDQILDNVHFIDEEPGSYYVDVCKDVTNDEAIVQASLRADPAGRREYARFRNALTVDSVNAANAVHAADPVNAVDAANKVNEAQKHPPGTHLQFGVPFTHKVTITARGKRIKVANSKGPDQWGFMVTEIDEMSVRLFFYRLYRHRKNDGKQGANADEEGLEEAWAGGARRPAALEDGDEVRLHSSDDPMRGLDAHCVMASGGFKAIELEIVDEPKLCQRFAKKQGGAKEVEFDGDFSTGDPRDGREGSAELKIETEQSRAFPLTLADFFATLNELRRAGHRFETIAVSDNYQENETGDIVNFYPRNIGGMKSWHRMSPHPKAPTRGYVVATIQSGGVSHYLLELERKGDKGGGHALMHLRSVDGEPIAPLLIRAYMLRVAVNNRWTSSGGRPGWIFDTVNHKTKTENKLFAAAIAKNLGLTFVAKTSENMRDDHSDADVATSSTLTGRSAVAPSDTRDRTDVPGERVQKA